MMTLTSTKVSSKIQVKLTFQICARTKNYPYLPMVVTSSCKFVDELKEQTNGKKT